MGKYVNYSRKLGSAFKEAREAYDKALKELKAEERRYETACVVDKGNPVRLLSAEASYRSAQAIFKEKSTQIWRDFETLCDSTTQEFKSKLRADQTADPSQMDMATVELLRSGICTPQDLQSLASRFSGNPTMLRLISQEAKSKADQNSKDYTLRAPYFNIATQIDSQTVDLEKSWDEMTGVFKIITGQAHGRGDPGYTQSMNSQYEKLAEPMVESF